MCVCVMQEVGFTAGEGASPDAGSRDLMHAIHAAYAADVGVHPCNCLRMYLRSTTAVGATGLKLYFAEAGKTFHSPHPFRLQPQISKRKSVQVPKGTPRLRVFVRGYV